jgi:hypothetical protein
VGKLSAAVSDAERCIELKPEWGKGYSRLGTALFKRNDLDGAQKVGEVRAARGARARALSLHSLDHSCRIFLTRVIVALPHT